MPVAQRIGVRLQFYEALMTPFTQPQDAIPAAPLRGWLLALAVSLATSVVIVLPYFWMGNASGHDIQFHVASWLDVASQWKEGMVYPRWTEWTNHGFGEPRYIFYPPLSWMLGAGLSFVVGWSRVPAAFVLVVQTFAGLTAVALARRMVAERAAVFAAVCYAANPNVLLMIYIRSDFAEQLACAFFPLLVLGALEIAGLLENRRRSRAGEIVFFATWFAAVWLANAPAGVIVSYSMALFFGWTALTQKSWPVLARGVAGLALGLGLAAFYLVPAAYEQRWVNIGQALSSGLLPGQNFLFTEMNDPEHTLVNWIVSGLAVLLMVITGFAALGAQRDGASGRENGVAERRWKALVVLSAAASLLMMRVTSLVWEYLPKLRFVQFPWRWMSVLAVTFICFFAVVAAKRLGWLWVSGVLAIFLACGVFLVQHAWWDENDVRFLQKAIAQGRGMDGTDEYDPIGDDHYDLPVKAPQLEILPMSHAHAAGVEARIHIDRWTTDEKEIRINSREPLRLGLRLLNYPAWRVEVNGAVIQPERPKKYNQMIVVVPAGDARIRVIFARTADRIAGIVFSCLSLLIAAYLLLVGRKIERPI